MFPHLLEVRRRSIGAAWALGLALGGAAAVRADDVLVAKNDLTSLSLEQLMDMEVTSVSKTPDKYFQAPAAIYVITGEDIRRSGATSLAEALRLAPGMQVARVGSGQWAVGARGFASGLSRYTLVLIDGRSVYTPLFAGTYWDAQDTLLEDVDRIEVIRGPGGALWGANAVNGVINIITKKAQDTAGWLASAGGGTEERAMGAVRYGGDHEGFHYRAYGKYADRDASFSGPIDGYDGWGLGQGGFRADWGREGDGFTFQGDAYDAREGARKALAATTFPYLMTVAAANGGASGGNLSGRWSRPGDFPLSVQAYYDHTSRKDVALGQDVDTADVELQQSAPPVWSQRLTYGLSYRRIWDETRGPPSFHFDPMNRAEELKSVFVQDQAALVPDRLALTVGAKSERNTYTGWENQPGVRLAWTPTDRQTVWSAVSRAVRTPSRLDRDPELTFFSAPDFSPPITLFKSQVGRYSPNPAFGSEKLVAYEAGYRVRPGETVFADAAGFFNRYDDLQSLAIARPFVETDGPVTRTVFPFIFENKLRGRTYGGEVDAVWNPGPGVRFEGSYSYLRINLENKGGSADGVSARDKEGLVPRHQAVLRLSLESSAGVTLDPTARYVSPLPGPQIPAYWTGDMRVGWVLGKGVELSVVGQNLFQPRHAESAENGNQVQRGVYGKVTWRLPS